jgi:hypothetical protein
VKKTQRKEIALMRWCGNLNDGIILNDLIGTLGWRALCNATPSTPRHQHHAINTTPSTPRHQHHAINTTPMFQ